MALHPGLERAEWAVFHGAVSDAVPALDALAALDGRSQVYADWLRGVALGAMGRYGEALDVVARIPSASPEFSMARSLRASLLRQIGVHDLALVADREARASAATPGAAVEALTGLAADSVGLQDLLNARAALDQAESLLARVGADPIGASTWWRHRVRVHWVRCEVALLDSDPLTAGKQAGLALAAAEAASAPRHVAKSLLFTGVAQVESGQREQAVATLRRSLLLSSSMGYQAVAWPTHAVLAAILAPADPQAAHGHFVQASRIAREVGQGLTGDLAQRWDARPDIRLLHSQASST